MESNVTLIISFIVYNIFIIGFGLYSARQKKNTSDDFVLANRELGPWASSLSASASSESGWVMLGLVGEAFAVGTGAFWIIPGIACGYLFNWFVIAEKLRLSTSDSKVVTIPQYIVHRFGKNSTLLKLLPSIIIILAMLGYVAAQMNAAGKAFDAVFHLPYWLGVLIGAFIILTYTLYGGFRAVCWTDIIQAGFMFVALLIMPFIVLSSIGGFGTFLDKVQAIDPNFLSFTGGKTSAALFGFIIGSLGIGLGYPGQPHILSRFMAVKDKLTINRAGLIAIIWMVLVYVGAIFFGMFARVYFGGGLEDTEQALPMAVGTLLPPIVGGFVIAAIVSAICSTADSQLIVVSTIISRDILPFFKKIKNYIESDFKRTVLMDKLVLVILSVLSVLFALTENRVIFSFVLYAWSVLGASFGPVVILGLLWKKTTKGGAIAGMLTGTIITIVWRETASLKAIVYELVPAFFIALIAVLVVSLLTYKKES